jgi:hypothetical protein
MTHTALLWAVDILAAVAIGTTSLLDALHALKLQIVRCGDCYLFSSCSRDVLMG